MKEKAVACVTRCQLGPERSRNAFSSLPPDSVPVSRQRREVARTKRWNSYIHVGNETGLNRERMIWLVWPAPGWLLLLPGFCWLARDAFSFEPACIAWPVFGTESGEFSCSRSPRRRCEEPLASYFTIIYFERSILLYSFQNSYRNTNTLTFSILLLVRILAYFQAILSSTRMAQFLTHFETSNL